MSHVRYLGVGYFNWKTSYTDVVLRLERQFFGSDYSMHASMYVRMHASML
jgi:hypothetical protein